ncbi:hypothetical protein LJC72_00030 [Bacteroides sp. OttesenSCG-928-D19]|nr:hypothetical protein [Bacteroides sp. OttesenSCG-928-N06]MDL2303717.1 hypothetical protein [Bacteroides sp. OttesenSCG-928-D19]
MKNIFKYMAGVLIAGFAMTACSPEEFAGANGDIPVASSYESAIEILVDQETNQVTFNLNSKGCMPVWIIDGKSYSTVNGMQKIYTIAGDYTVDVKIANANGISDGTITKTFHLDNSIVDFSKYITFLAGDSSKEWQIAKDQQGHLGCGESGSDGLGWWSAGPNEKANAGLYDDIITFDKNKNYTYNPGESGTVYVNKGVSYFSEFNPNDDNDFMAQVSEQKTTYDFSVVGTDLYVTFPSKTLFPYIATDQSYDNPRYKVLSMNTKTMELVSDYGDIAWHYKLTCDAKKEFAGFKYDSDCNMWKTATVDAPGFWYAPNWNQIADPEYTFSGSTYKLTLPEATFDTWQAQMSLLTDIGTNAATNYDFSIIFNASKNHSNVTIKLQDAADDNIYYFVETVKLTAYEDYVFYKSDMDGLDIGAIKLVFDFGRNEADTEMTFKNIVLKEHSCDDGTILPTEEPEDDVNWLEEAASNLWRQATITNTFWYAPGWNQIDDPTLDINNYKYTITMPSATFEQWQAQAAFITDMSTVSTVNYDFRCIFNSSQDINGVTIKLQLDGNDDLYYFVERVDLKAYEDYTFKKVDMPGIDMDKIRLVFDFGGNPDNTEVTISGIVLQEHGAGKVNWLPDSDCNMWKSMSYTNFYYYAPGWSQIADPEVTANGNNYKVVLPTATYERWQAQVGFKTDMTTNAATNYDFHCILNADKDLTGVTLKLVVEGDDGIFYFEDRVNLTAYEDYTYEQVSMPGIDMSSANMVFDFGGNPDNTEVVISNVILKESDCTN